MAKVQDIAELLVASWVLSNDPSSPESLPAVQGLLDRALYRAMEKGAYPESWRRRLHFVDARVGLKCVELNSVISAAQVAAFTSDPNPSYEATDMKVGVWAARQLLRRHAGVTEPQVKEWGVQLRTSLEEAKDELKRFPTGAAATG